MQSVNRWWLSLFLILLICSVVISPGVAGSDAGDDDYYAIVYIVDGLHPDMFVQMIDNGELPNIRKYIYDRGAMADPFITVFPSITLPAMTTLMTGQYPGNHKIPAFHWFNRDDFSYRSYIGLDILFFEKDLCATSKRMFDYFERGDSASFGIIAGTTTGTDDSLLFTSLNPLHKLAPFTHLAIKDLLSKIGVGSGIPHIMALYEWGVILRSYQNPMRSDTVKEVMLSMDNHYGDLIREYEKHGILNRTYLLVVSDHGLYPVDQTFYIDNALKEAGFSKRLISYNLGEPYVPFTSEDDEKPSRMPFLPFYEDRVDSLFSVPIDRREYHVIVGSNAGGAATLYFAKNGGYDNDGNWSRDNWKEPVVYGDLLNYNLGTERGYVNVIDIVSKCEGVDFFIVKDNLYVPGEEFRVRVVSRHGESLITRRGDHSHDFTFKYTLLSGKDPLGYVDHPDVGRLVDGTFHDQETWFIATKNHTYPDGCMQLSQCMQTERTGTIVLSCADTWGVNCQVVNKHGGLLGDEMRATFCIAGPGIEHGVIAGARTADLAPSLLYLLNKPFNPKDFDGRVIRELRLAVEARQREQSPEQSSE